MLKKTAIRTGSAALILMMGACSWFQQPAAPVVSGTTGAAGSYGSSSASGTDNPYGAAPYDPASAGGSSVVNNTPAPYTPPAATPSAPVSSGGSYTPSNAPVDVNAATHTVVRGDTVYNISKRYNISQDDLRAWNNLSENSIGVGQVLRVKPAGYTGETLRGGELGSNGLLLDKTGQLILCQHGDRRIARMDAPINKPEPNFTTLAAGTGAERFDFLLI